MWLFKSLPAREMSSFYQEVYHWYLESPEILKTNWQLETDELQFVKDLQNGMNFIGEKDGIFVAMVHGEPKTDKIIEGHLFCLPGVPVDFLISLITFAKHKALEKYELVTTQTPIKHKGMLIINKRAGFLDSGIRSWNGVYKGQLLEIQHNMATR